LTLVSASLDKVSGAASGEDVWLALLCPCQGLIRPGLLVFSAFVAATKAMITPSAVSPAGQDAIKTLGVRAEATCTERRLCKIT
jgi:hypothetical protein